MLDRIQANGRHLLSLINDILDMSKIEAGKLDLEDVAFDPAELARWCEGRLPYFAIPRYIDVVDDLPRTENGKVQKFKLREQGVGPNTWVLKKSGYQVQR